MATKVINLDSLTAVRARFEALKTFDDVAAFDAWAEQQLATIEIRAW
ncbi:MAG: hypothetical protein Q8K32_32355 [Archangium sp.]|nr:hypothetical protein [Archangium sp.]